MCLRWRAVVFLAAFLVLPSAVHAQDALSRARQASTRTEGLDILERHLALTPRDVDARLLYGLMLSWEGRYDAARRELRLVLEQTPAYTDARVGLMNVEWWSGHRREARELANLILSRDPGHPVARRVRQQLDAADRPWTLTVSASADRFNDGRATWQEQFLSLTRETPAGSLILRSSRAERFGFTDEQFEIEFYPSVRPGTYAYVAVGFAPDHALYPTNRMAFDLYQSLGRGVEVSGGYRRLAFGGAPTHIYLGTLTKYLGNWMLTGKVYHVPGEGSLDSTSGHAQARRYFGSSGTSFLGMGYSRGLSREEIRGAGDLLSLDNDTVRGQLDALVTERWRLKFDVSSSRQERARASALWQTSVGAGFAIQF